MNTQGIRPMRESDLIQVLTWRNHPTVRKYMYSTHEIQMDEHLAWYAHASQNPSRALLIFERDGNDCGFVDINRTRCPDIADWGFFLAPDAPRGSGRGLGAQAIKYAFEELSLHKVCGQSLVFNSRSICFHKRLGFTQEGVLREQHFDGEKFHDVVCFGLLRNEWPAFKKD